MKMKLRIVAAAMLLAYSTTAQTLDDYLQTALENNLGIRAKQTEFQAAMQKVPQAGALPDPTVNVTAFIRPMMLPMGNQLGSISVMQMFPWFGTLKAMENEAARMAGVKLQAVSVAQNELVFKVKNAWYPLLELKEQLAIQRELLRLLETDKELATAITMRKPMIGAGLQYMPLVKRKDSEMHIPPNTGRDMFMPMVSVTVPIWRKKYDAAVEERRLMQLMYADMKQDMENDLSAMYEMAFFDMEKSAQMAELLNSQMVKTQQVIDLLMAAYSNAGKDFDEILRLQQQLFRYRMELVSQKLMYQLAQVKLDYLTGK